MRVIAENKKSRVLRNGVFGRMPALLFARAIRKFNFTKSEYQICKLLARRRGQVFSKEQIYEMIFGYEGIGDASAI